MSRIREGRTWKFHCNLYIKCQDLVVQFSVVLWIGKLSFRRGSTPVSTVLRKSVRFFIINTFLIIKNTFQVETWSICYLSDSKTQERGLKGLNTKTFLGKPAPQIPLDSACAFGRRLGNRSVFIPDPRLSLVVWTTCRVSEKVAHGRFIVICI